MNRRKACKVLGLSLAGAAGVGLTMAFWKKGAKEKVKSGLRQLKPTFRLPAEGTKVSVEKALNSRCTSDYDGDSSKFHWGKFDRWKKLTNAQMDEVISLARVPRFTKGILETRRENNVLTFINGKTEPGVPQNWAMVEIGMQQQAVCLVCAALGVGMVFSNLGKDGKWVSETEYAAIRMKLGAMEPSYEGAYWTSFPPAAKNPWQRGNLEDPVRDGHNPLISILANLKTEDKSSVRATEQSISQLLWAGRGRTPHLHNSKPWGMTIPTWAGEQNISSVYLVSENELFKYANWSDNRPTHSLLQLNTLEAEELKKLLERFSAKQALIVLGKNESFARALWEVGYQLLNILVQASSLDISYSAFLLNESERANLAKIGIVDPVAAVAI
jgi:hypothetical protein